MAMNGKTLGDDIADVIISDKATAEMKAQIKELWERIGAVIVSHIQDNAQVLPGITVSTPSGPGATTGEGQIQ